MAGVDCWALSLVESPVRSRVDSQEPCCTMCLDHRRKTVAVHH